MDDDFAWDVLPKWLLRLFGFWPHLLECPWEAIYEDVSVPGVFEEDTKLNAKIVDAKDDFEVPTHTEKDQPTPEQVAENKKKWGNGSRIMRTGEKMGREVQGSSGLLERKRLKEGREETSMM